MPRPQTMIAVGIGVADMEKSVDFYVNVLGMQKQQVIELGYLTEVVVGYPGTSLVLMHWNDDSNPNYRDNPVKLVFYVPDPAGMIEKIRAAGGEITREATPIPEMNDLLVGLAKDPDGYVVEFLKTPVAVAAEPEKAAVA